VRRRLAVLVSATMALVLVAFVVPLAILVRVIVADRAVSSATSAAQQLSAEVAAGPTDASLRASVLQLTGSGRPMTVFLGNGETIGSRASRTASVRLARQKQSSFTVEMPGGREILVAVVGAPGRTSVVRTFVSNAELTHGVTQAWLILAGLGLVLLALGVVIAVRLAGTVTRPIAELAEVSHRLADGDLEARADPAGPPEVREVAGSLNYLAGRIRELIWQERETFADLSHRLRTPLTALRLEAEAADSGNPDGRLTSIVGALEQAVTSLIEDARRRGGRPGSSDAAKVTAERAAFWSVLADDQGREMRVQVPDEPVPVGLAAADLAASLDVLLGNVFAHTPEGSAFTVGLTARPGGGGELSVLDTGPGFDPSRDPVRRGASGGGSTGLGLDIARQAAEASGGSLVIRNGVHGAEVVATFGPPRRTGGPGSGVSRDKEA
jgi:signal transduction histidine kinase